MHQLPNELYEKIFTFCSTPVLFTLTLVDRRITCVANPLLYRKIQTLRSLSKIVQLLSTLLFFDQIAPLVQSLRVDFVWWSASLSKPIPRKDIYLCVKKVGTRKTFAAREVLNTYFSLLSGVLCKTRNLRNLELIFEHVDSIDQTFGYLVKGFPSQLQSLTTSFQLGPALGQFLETQCRLRELRLGNHVPYPTPFLDDLHTGPLLQVTTMSWSMKTPMEVVRYLAERASLRSIIVDLTALMIYYSTSMEHYFDIGDSSKKVEYARIEFGPGFKMTCIPMILDSFPSLKSLNMILDTVTEVSIVVVLTKTSCTELDRGESHEDPHLAQRTEHHKSCRHHRVLFQSVGSGILHLPYGEEFFRKVGAP